MTIVSLAALAALIISASAAAKLPPMGGATRDKKAAPFGFAQPEANMPGLHYVPGEKLQRVVLDSDEPWFLLILESDERCGEACADMKQTVSTATTKAGGIFNFAYVNSHDAIVGRDGDMVEAFKEFNLTTIPTMIIYGPGPKTVHLGMRMDSNTAGSLLQNGPKALYQSMRMFLPGMVSSVRTSTLPAFLTTPAPLLSRVVLFTDKRDVSLTYKKLSMDFAPRASFGQIHVDESGGKLAKLFGLDKADAPALLVGPAGPLPDALVDEATIKSLPADHLNGWKRFSGNMTYEYMRKFLYTSIPPTPVLQLRTQADFTKYCSESSDVTLCFIGILPAEAEAASVDRATQNLDPDDAFLPPLGFEQADDDDDDEEDEDDTPAVRRRKGGARTLDTLSRVASRVFVKVDWSSMSGDLKAERHPVAFMWVDAEKQPAFVESFKVQSPGFIALVPRRKKFAVMRGSFQPRNLYDFLLSVMDAAMPGARAGLASNGPSSLVAQAGREPVALESIDSLPRIAEQPALKKPTKKSAGKTAKKPAAAKEEL